MRHQVRHKSSAIILLLVLFSGAIHPSFAQKQDTTSVNQNLQLDEVVITASQINKEVIPVQVLSGKELKKLSVHSVADAVRYFSGVQVKDYID